jgi:hypothetical protein
MILKMSHTNHDTGRTEWTMYDNIVSASTGYEPKEKCKIVTVAFKGDDNMCAFPVREKAFLCNDDGKTIEAIYPEITE